jgi:hypothetical protein
VALDQVMSNSSRGTGHGIKKAAKIKKKKEDDTKKAAEKAAKQEKRDDNKRQRAEERSAVTNQAGKQIDGNCEPEIGGEQAQSFGLFDRFGGHLRPGSKQCPLIQEFSNNLFEQARLAHVETTTDSADTSTDSADTTQII